MPALRAVHQPGSGPSPALPPRESNKEVRERLLNLRVGQKVIVWWNSEGKEGEVREIIPGLEVGDWRVRLWYSKESVELTEHLAFMVWEVSSE